MVPMRILRMVILSASLWVATSAPAQEQVQAAMDGLSSAEQAGEVALLLRQLPHVRMARVDAHTRNLLMHVDSDFAMDKPALNDVLQPVGVQVRCWRRRPIGQAPFKHVDAAGCGDDQPDQ